MYRYGADEVIQQPGTVPYSMKFVVAGQVELVATASDGSPLTVRRLDEGDFLGQTALTREPVTAGAVALTEVTVLEIDREIVEDLVAAQAVAGAGLRSGDRGTAARPAAGLSLAEVDQD